MFQQSVGSMSDLKRVGQIGFGPKSNSFGTRDHAGDRGKLLMRIQMVVGNRRGNKELQELQSAKSKRAKIEFNWWA
jgi:hypothetical protein